MIVRWTETAIGHLVAIEDYIGRDSRQYSRRTLSRITLRTSQIAAFPLSGEKVPEYEDDSIREVIEWPFRIIYEIVASEIHVLAVIHGSRELPAKLPRDPDQ